ncbi:MAG: hypothetical protein DWQ11_18815 [Proteobacteria bacterium]|nr:MAG: hypothetical protein DWQ11_18815 [Pseudomonadota bacterium]
MANTRTLQRSFAGGEVTPELFGRIDDTKYQAGLALCRNFITKPQGPAENRAGFAFVREVKDSTKRVRLIPFTYSIDQTMVIELGDGCFRFHTGGATLSYSTPSAWVTSTAYAIGDLVAESGANYYCVEAHTSGTFATDLSAGKWYSMPADMVYEIPSPYAEADLFDVHYVQSADVLTLVHPNYAPRELRRLGATNWQLATINFAAAVTPPAAPTLVAAGHTAVKYTYHYVVTTVGADGVEESAASASSNVGGNLFETGATVTISWGAVAGAARYNVYKMQGGVYGYIGRTSDLSLVDANIAPDLSKTPPIYDTVFNATGDYPAAVSYFEQRRCFAGTTNKPQNIWMTRSGTESNMSYGLPVKDDDRIAFRVAAREANAIRHIVPLTQLLLLTAEAEWRVSSINSDAITPTTISVRPQSYVGASNVQPVIVNNSLIYAASRGGHARELGYNWQAGGFITGDLTLRSAHLFDGFDILDMAYAKAPQPIVWMVSSSGKLLGLTYVPEQQIGAWHQHDTDGVFESCAVVAEDGYDALYCVISRTIDGQSVRYVERMAPRSFTDQADAFIVDCGLTYSGAPADEISGLDHLEGKTVNILADGAVHPQRVVTSGAVTLDIEASTVHVGLPIEADLQTLPLAVQLQDGSFGQGRVKNINKVWLRVFRSSGIFVGPSADELTEAKQRTTENYGTPPALKSEEIPIMLTPSWADGGQIFVRQYDPLPLTVVSLTAEVSLGG